MLRVRYLLRYTSSQLYKNYKLKSAAAEALSMGFLVCWLIGDCFFIISGICKVFWLDQMPHALLAVGVWYTLADLALILQTIFYRKNYTVTVLQERRLAPNEHNLVTEREFEQQLEGKPSTPKEVLLTLRSVDFMALLPLVLCCAQLIFASPLPMSSDPEVFIGRNILFEEDIDSYRAIQLSEELKKLTLLADICSWLAFIFFTGARLPQLYKNVRPIPLSKV